MTQFIELKSTNNTVVVIRKEAISAFEVVPASQRVESHVKVFGRDFTFFISIDKEEFIRLLKS
ncbi:MAG: hypothetical protein K1X29_04380 [Bdellovibrionales bacterium]|nr:hypothetical protein [Bdellovibrionales bacterium]